MVGNKLLAWLLEEDNPSVRYFVLKELLGLNEKDLEPAKAKNAIRTSKKVVKIFSKQNPVGYWEDSDSPYLPKYKSSYWTIMLLSQLGIDKKVPEIEKACEHIFQFQHKEGGFVSQTEKNLRREYNWHLKRGKRLHVLKEWLVKKIHEGQSSCLTGNMVVALCQLGYQSDPRTMKALNWLVRVQNRDGGWLCPYWGAHINDTHGCFYGTICPLEAFTEVPKKFRSDEMKTTIKRGAEFLLMHHLFKADHHNFRVINKSWLKLSFPWFYDYNILRGLDILTKLGYTEDKRLHDAVELLLSKRLSDGRWILENTPTGRMQVNFETKGRPSKWLTLIALRILLRLEK